MRSRELHRPRVVCPKLWWANLMRVSGQPERALPNPIPLQRGCLRWTQAQLIVEQCLDATDAAKFDEYDDSTALEPAEPTREGHLPDIDGASLNAEGCALRTEESVQAAATDHRAADCQPCGAAVCGRGATNTSPFPPHLRPHPDGYHGPQEHLDE